MPGGSPGKREAPCQEAASQENSPKSGGRVHIPYVVS
jgi:hypothetical protein